MARQRIYANDSDVTALDRLTGIDALDNSTKNFAIEAIAQLFASTGIADSAKSSWFYKSNAGRTANEPGQFYYNFISGMEMVPVAVDQIVVNRFDNSAKDFRPIERYVEGTDIKISSVSNAADANYAVYEVLAATDNGDTLTLDVKHLASAGTLADGEISLSLLGAALSSETRGVAVNDGDFIPQDTDESLPTYLPGVAGDLYFRIFQEAPFVQDQVDLYFFAGPNDPRGRTPGWFLETRLNGEQGPQGVSVVSFQNEGIVPPTSSLPVTVTATGFDPATDTSGIDLGSFEVPSGIQGDQGVSITDVESNIPTPAKGDDQILTFDTIDPSTGASGELPTKITLPSGAQGDQGLFYVTLFKAFDKTPVPDVEAPLSVVFNETLGFPPDGDPSLEGWTPNPPDHEISTQSLYEVRQDLNPATEFDSAGNAILTRTSWGSPFVAGDQGPQGIQGFQGIGVDIDTYVPPTNTELGTTTTVDIPLMNPDPDGETPDDISFDIPSGVQGEQGFQGIGIDVDEYVEPDNTELGTPTTVNIPLMNPDPEASDPLDISFTIPSGVAGMNGVLSNKTGVVDRLATTGNETAIVSDAGVLTISLAPMSGTVDTPQPQATYVPSESQTFNQAGDTLDYAVTITDVHGNSEFTYTLTTVTRLSGDTNFIIPSLTPGTTNSITISAATAGTEEFHATLEATHTSTGDKTNSHINFTLVANAYVPPPTIIPYYTRSVDGIANPLVSTADRDLTDSSKYTEVNQNVVSGTVLQFTRPDSGNYTGVVGIANSVGIDTDASFNNGTAVPDTFTANAPSGYTLYAFPLHLPTSTITITIY